MKEVTFSIGDTWWDDYVASDQKTHATYNTVVTWDAAAWPTSLPGT